MEKGRIFNIERYAIHDGPGIRTTVFFKGCPLRCWWCHNPEGQNPGPELVYRENRCVGCGECLESCAKKALSLVSRRIILNRKECSVCGACAQICPSEALTIAGKEMKVEEMIKEIEMDRVFYDESKGGVTFSGGEPLFQPDFLDAILHECNERDIHTVLDTCGYAPRKIVESIRDKVDLFLYDMKIIDDAEHRKYVGVSNKLILQNLERLARNGSHIAISLPIIPRINDDEESILKMGKHVSSLPSIEYVSLLPYHKAGIDKYKNLGKPYRLKRMQPPTHHKIKMIKETFETFGLKVKVGGR